MPLFFLCYYAVPRRIKNGILLLGSLSFYFVGAVENPEHFFIFLASIGVDYAAGRLMEKEPEYKKWYLAGSIGFHLFCLGLFKYAGFVTGELNRPLPGADVALQVVLPIGISFYTFQGISYLVDVYRGTVQAEKSLLRYAVYISMFEQLIAGPIVTYEHVQKELRKRTISKKMILRGMGIFVFGLGMKVLLANPVGKLWTQIGAIGYDSISTPLAWMGILAFSLQIYFDFFGYSLMAIGLGKMLGFRLPKNFNHPYISKSMTEFWRRWHITLGSWFREYVYIPLGGNRKGLFCTIRNLLIVWLLTGIWHGAGYNFLLWGFLLFCLLTLEKLGLGTYLNRYPILGHGYMFLMIPLSWTVFAIDDLSQLGVFFTRLFPFFGQGVWSVFRYDYLKYLGQYYPFFLVGILFSTRLPYKWLGRIRKRLVIGILLTILFGASLYCMYRGMDDPFLYFRF